MLELAWLIPIFSFVACAVLLFFGGALQRRMGEAVGWISVAGIAAGIPLALGCLVQLARGASPVQSSFLWAPLGSVGANLRFGFAVDALAAVMLVMVTVVASCIIVYSIGYMHGDKRYSRFFAYMSLFTGSMLLLVLADNFLVLYIGWELVGLCSYLLIGFWFERKSAANAAKKAFITTRVADVGFAVGILMLFQYVPSLNFAEVFAAASAGLIPVTVVGVAAAFLFIGAMGKSAQFPLHTWLPDAMEGPTPVSALIHAATMVAAGVYMVARLFPLFIISFGSAVLWGVPAMLVVGIIGLITALLAATLGLVQNDIKRVLAYSTVSQLGYMMAALGMGVVGFAAAVLHLIVHAFFKALLFMCSGSVIHGCGGEQNMKKMGGLARRMPVTYWTMWVGALALAGIFPLAGFWSKDHMMAAVWDRSLAEPVYWIFFLGLELAAIMTAAYIGRMCFLTFAGTARSDAAEEAHESPAVMTVPLMILAAFTVLLGIVGTQFIGGNLFSSFVSTEMPGSMAVAGLHGPAHGAHGFNWIVAGISTLMALTGLLTAIVVYRWHWLDTRLLKRYLAPWYRAALNRYYIDDFYQATVVRGTLALAEVTRICDQYIIDGLVNAIGWGTRVVFSTLIRLFDDFVVDGAINVGAWVTGFVGRVSARAVHHGEVQEYVAGFAVIAAGLAGMVYLVVMLGW